MKKIEEAVKNALREIEQSELIADDDTVRDSFLEEMDSITLMTFILQLEDILDIRISWNGIEKEMSYKDFIEYIAKEIG